MKPVRALEPGYDNFCLRQKDEIFTPTKGMPQESVWYELADKAVGTELRRSYQETLDANAAASDLRVKQAADAVAAKNAKALLEEDARIKRNDLTS